MGERARVSMYNLLLEKPSCADDSYQVEEVQGID